MRKIWIAKANNRNAQGLIDPKLTIRSCALLLFNNAPQKKFRLSDSLPGQYFALRSPIPCVVNR